MKERDWEARVLWKQKKQPTIRIMVQVEVNKEEAGGDKGK